MLQIYTEGIIPNQIKIIAMKRIGEHRKLLGVDKSATLKDLKTIYRNTMKEAHPDKFVNDEEAKLEAEERSKSVIEAYHFLVSINPETQEKYKEEYTETTSKSNIQDFEFEKQILKIQHLNGKMFEYIGVPRNTYIKMVNADSPSRFARRHIYGNFIYRKSGEAMVD
ncbi:chaperone with DnaK; heat shock protein [Flavobacteriaceae bacterium 3519-10]|nr:chaperone with DnaK; heat shock protein [Flavobacteriaceae bacterium 3519-10]